MVSAQARRATSAPGQFSATLAVTASSAHAAASLGRAVCMAADTAAGGGSGNEAEAGGCSTSSSDGASSNRKANAARQSAGVAAAAAVAAPFVSLIGRSLYHASRAVVAGVGAGGMAVAEFDRCADWWKELDSSMQWLVQEPACRSLLDAASACSSADGGGGGGVAEAEALYSELRQLLSSHVSSAASVADQEPSGSSARGAEQGRAFAKQLCDSCLAQRLQVFGGALGGSAQLGVRGVCANPACLCLSDMSELALVSPTAHKKGHGRCSGCAAVSYCSRECQQQHWPVHKAECARAGRQQQQPEAAASTEAPADSG